MVMEIRNIFRSKKDIERDLKYEQLQQDFVDFKSEVLREPKSVNRQLLVEAASGDNAYRQKQTIQLWRDSLEYIEGTNNYTDPLFQIYREIELDSHIQSTVLLRKSRVTQLPFDIEWIDEKKNEKDDDPVLEQAEHFLNQKWFYKFMNYALDAPYEGYAMIEIEKVNDDGSLEIGKIPFNHTKPRFGVFIKSPTDLYSNGIDVSKEPYSNYVMEIFDKRTDLGLYCKIAPLFLWSRNAHQAWSQFAEIFGMPIRVGKTVKQDAGERKKVFNMLKQMGASLAVLLDKEDEIQLIQTQNTDAFNVYDKFISLCNSEINKLVLGATMINEDGSSYSQSQVHQQQFDSLVKQDIMSMEHIVNNILFPRLQKLGLLPEGIRFCFDTSESLNIFQKFEMDKALMQYFELDIDYLNKMYSTEIVASKQSSSPFDTIQPTE